MTATAEAAPEIELRQPDAFQFLLDPPLGAVRYRVAYGGRGGAKSWSIARALVILAAQQPLRILCTREYQSSIRESVHRLLAMQIERLQLDAFFRVEKARIVGVLGSAKGSEFIFHGLHRDPDKIKSLEAVDLCWVEEGHTTSADSWRVLTPTIRTEGSEIWVSFNPDHPDDPLYKFFVEDPPEGAIVRKVGWRDNPYISQALRDERSELLRRDPEAEAHVWGGEPWMRAQEQVFAGKWRVEEFDTTEENRAFSAGEKAGEFSPWGEPLYGADWGFAQDPTVLLQCWVRDSRLWIEHEARGIGWSTDETERRFREMPGIPDQPGEPDPRTGAVPIDGPVIRADCARPETIHELRLRGLNVEAAAKWTGSIEDGISYLRGFEEIVIHPRCEGTISDHRMYRYKVDPRTGDVLPKIIDAHNHGPDAVRYALVKLIRKRRKRKGRLV